MPTKKKASTPKMPLLSKVPVASVEAPVGVPGAPSDTPGPVVAEPVAPVPGPYHGRHTFHRLEMPTSVQTFTTDIYQCICGATLELTAETRFSRRQPAVIKVRMRGE